MSIDDEKISRLYHETESPGPSKSLDDAILSASRKAVEKPAGKAPFSGSQAAFASVAAVIVIAIILVPVLKQEESLQKMEQAPAENSRSRGRADEERLKLHSVVEPKKKSMGAPSSARESVMELEKDVSARGQALPVSSMPGSSAARIPGVSKSASTADEEQPEADPDDTTHSRMEAADSAPFAILTPEMWEVKITRLIENGELEQAEAELEKLEKHFPDHQISTALLKKLRP